ncbi:hypothetical protein WA026_001102 [Henosepilachna vigintioctopunctata]|uniref:Uncharacterized protein n=1 Tax=Henosepilachna vigintioctopunctata TaxID=420089 RepID=A0AAW1UZS3_9CUCU
MRIPSTINVNTLKCYELKEGFGCTSNHVINCQNYGILCEKSPYTLKQLCIISIAQNWTEHPKLEELVLPEDRCMLLSLLPEDLPLELTVPRIPDNMYWKKCYLKKWPSCLIRNVIDKDMFLLPSSLVARDEHSSLQNVEISSTNSDEYSVKNEFSQLKTWKQHYLENYMKEMLENLDPVKYDPEEIKILCDICGPYVKMLHLEQLRCYDGNELGHGGTRIALNAVLAGLSKLQEVSICFKQKYVGINNFSWNVIQLSVQDINSLSKGLEKNRLHILRQDPNHRNEHIEYTFLCL